MVKFLSGCTLFPFKEIKAINFIRTLALIEYYGTAQ